MHMCFCQEACSVQLLGRYRVPEIRVPGPGDKTGTVFAPKELQEETHQQHLRPTLRQAEKAVSTTTGNSLWNYTQGSVHRRLSKSVSEYINF